MIPRILLVLAAHSHCRNYRHKHPRLAPVWPRTAVARSDDQIRRLWVRFPPRSKIFSLPRVISHFLTRANGQQEILATTLALYIQCTVNSLIHNLCHYFYQHNIHLYPSQNLYSQENAVAVSKPSEMKKLGQFSDPSKHETAVKLT